MRTPYVPHYFGDEVKTRLERGRGWLTAGVASSIPWPSADVCIEYDGGEYILRGSERDGAVSPPGITIRCEESEREVGMVKVYRLTSILSWFHGGYVDVGGSMWGTRPILYGDARKVYSTMGLAGAKSFNSNHMPIIDNDAIRKALAFWREGKRLYSVHAGYSFLSFYKAIESQFANQRDKRVWISEHLDSLDDRAGERVKQLRSEGVDVGQHLFDSCRCAIAHASLGRQVVDPDEPSDRSRLAKDLDVMQQLATVYISDVLGVPNARTAYIARDRLAPWDRLIGEEVVAGLRGGDALTDACSLDGSKVAVGLWPDGPITGLDAMDCQIVGTGNGATLIRLLNDRRTIALVFHIDHVAGRLHTDLDRSGIVETPAVTEDDVVAYATYFHRVIGNAIAELTIDGFEPVDCEVVIPVNIIPVAPAEGIASMLDWFRRRGSAPT